MNPTQASVLLAVTGGAGSGKSAVCNRLKELGACCISSDELARSVVVPGSAALKQIVAGFGKRALLADGTLDRAWLRNEIVTDTVKREQLDRIMHPAILNLMHARITSAQKAGRKLIVVEVPLLYELNLADHFDKVLVVTAATETRIARIATRDGIDKTAARDLISTQLSEAYKIEHADFVIKNEGDYDKMTNSVDLLFKKLYQ